MSSIQKIQVAGTTYNITASTLASCSTAAATAAKVVDLAGFVLSEGATIPVQFKNGNTANAVTLNVNNTGAKNCISLGTVPAAGVVTVVYDGGDWIVCGKEDNKCYTTSTSDTAGTWTVTIPGITALTEGLTIKIRLGTSYNNSANTLNVNGLGAKKVYFKYGSALTSHYPTNSVIALTYTETATSSGTDKTGWLVESIYDSTNTQQLKNYYNRFPAKSAVYRYMMCFVNNDWELIPANGVSNSTATTKTLTTESFDIAKGIYYYNSTTTVAANNLPRTGTLYKQYGLIDLQYSFNTGKTLTANKPVYLAVVPQVDGQVKLANPPIVQTLPTTAYGNWYVYLGMAYDTYRIELDVNHPIYRRAGEDSLEYRNNIIEIDGSVYQTIKQVWDRMTEIHNASNNKQCLFLYNRAAYTGYMIYSPSGLCIYYVGDDDGAGVMGTISNINSETDIRGEIDNLPVIDDIQGMGYIDSSVNTTVADVWTYVTTDYLASKHPVYSYNTTPGHGGLIFPLIGNGELGFIGNADGIFVCGTIDADSTDTMSTAIDNLCSIYNKDIKNIYFKPTDGIPESDLSSAVRTKLNSVVPRITSITITKV